MSALFEPFKLKDVSLRNRIAIPPMCQYTAVDGLINDWHRVHLAGLARGGAGLVIVEATGVSPEGRITPGCTGLWNDAQAEAFAPVVAAIKAAGAVPGIQIGHAGRKASANRPWEGDDHISADDPRGWSTIAPSAIAFGANLPKVPKAMTLEDIARVREDFVAAISVRASSRRTPINVTMRMAAASRIAAASCWKRWQQCARCGPSICR
jgi:2,4-dienoyl-CoA reductase-like NADH-dependent reductase (Old Yellow Enzyme family)